MTTTKTPAGETIEINAGPAFKFASFYRTAGSDNFMVKYHRSENAARKGQWDSPAMRSIWTYAGYAPISR